MCGRWMDEGTRAMLADGSLSSEEAAGPASAASAVVDADVAAHDAGELDVADLVVVHVGPVDPRLLHGHAAEAEVPRTPVTAPVSSDWIPPIETSVSQPWAKASATRYSSLRTLLPPNAFRSCSLLVSPRSRRRHRAPRTVGGAGGSGRDRT